MTSLEVGAIVGAKYRLEREVARGGMGSVWQARHLQLDAPVAIKFMDHALIASDAARERFVREAKAAAQIQSPHVVHISDYGVDFESPYIVMELLSGEDLDTRLLRGPMSLHDTEQLVVQAAKGLRRAHEAGIVHRDLKPSNLFLAGDDEEWVVKIVDFGVAKAIGAAPIAMMPQLPQRSSEVTHTGMVLGSPQYMSPEQARGFKEVDYTADVWALGAIAFRAITGRRLFEGLDAMQVLTQLVYEPVPVPSQVAPDLPLPLRHFFDRALSRESRQRFQNAREMADAFSQAVAEILRQQDASSIAGATVPSPSYPQILNHPSVSQAFVPPRANRALPKIAIGVAGASLGVMMVAAVVASSTREVPLTSSASVGLFPATAERALEEASTAVRAVELAIRRREIERAEAAYEATKAQAAEAEAVETPPEEPPPPPPVPTGKRRGRAWGF